MKRPILLAAALCLALPLAGCGGNSVPVIAPSPEAIERAKAIGGSAIDPTHRDAEELLAIETGAAELSRGGRTADDGGLRPPPDPGATARRAVPRPVPNERDAGQAGKPDAGARRISAVAVPRVEGAPGSGNSELTAAMSQVLRDAGWPVRSEPGNDTLIIRGKVELGRETKGEQPIKLVWVVSDPAGAVLGTVKQANRVPAGSIDRGFGPNARYVAQAAAPSIFDLVRRAGR